MRVDSLTIENFHCFRYAVFEFAAQTTIFIGENGTGKSSLLKALCNSLSFIFTKSSSSWGFSSLSNEISDLSVANINVSEIFRNGSIADFVSILCSATMQLEKDTSESFKWELRKNSTDKASLMPSLYKDGYLKFRSCLDKTDRYPLLAYYSDRYPHVNTNLGSSVKKMLDGDLSISRTWGYYHWNDFTSCTEIWQKRFIRVSNLLLNINRQLNETTDEGARQTLFAEKNELEDEMTYVTSYLKKFTDTDIKGLSDKRGSFKISSVSVDGVNEMYLKFLFADGVQRSWNELPAGLERLLSIVFDIAYRSYILNRGKATPEGIVIIDELDLHLHPILQQDVLLRLTTAFPNIQFIIATHSPLIITNLRQDKRNKVVRMDRNGQDYTNEDTGNLFIHDYSYTLSEIMLTPPRNATLQALKEKYIRLRLRGHDEKAVEVAEWLHSLIGDSAFEELKSEMESDIAKG